MKPRLLLVDDSEVVLNIIEKSLAGISENDRAADGIEALKKLNETKYNGVFLDISMPDCDGFQVLEVLSQKDIDVPITVLTGSNDAKTIRKVCSYGADYIEKPVKPETIREKAISMIGRSYTETEEEQTFKRVA